VCIAILEELNKTFPILPNVPPKYATVTFILMKQITDEKNTY